MGTYDITAKRDDARGVLEKVRLDGGEVATKAQVISWIIDGGHDFYTKPPRVQGARVRVVAGSYLRTDSNDTQRDNLEHLPDF